jgi:AraC family transcriptional regulator
VFPRTAVWIQNEGARRFLADPSLTTIYNRAQRYRRFAADDDGDRCDWFAVSDDVAREIAAAFDPAAGALERPFRFQSAPSTATLYYRQREVLCGIERGELDAFAAEEAIIGVVTSVLAHAYGRSPEPLAHRGPANARRRALAEAARLEILRTLHENRSVSDLAAALDTSPFHLCRVFRAQTGRTMHEYRTELRVRRALDLLGEQRSATLAEIAHRLGFASHSHFVRALRRYIGVTPTSARRMLSS